jgi:hypothetical protein
MKKPTFWLTLALVALAVAIVFKLWPMQKPTAVVTPQSETVTTAPVKPPPSASPFSPAPNQGAPAKPKPLVEIQDGKTIDFSSGAPIVKDNAQEKALIERSVKEMEAAVQNITFGPKAAPKK